MITNKLLATVALCCGWTGCALLFLSFIIYAVKRQDYYQLVADYKEKHLLPGPCVFYTTLGFFGAFQTIRFFIKLSKKQRISFLRRDDAGYTFFDDKNSKIAQWMRVFVFLWYMATVCYILAACFVLLLP